jgi:hypothetical protein
MDPFDTGEGYNTDDSGGGQGKANVFEWPTSNTSGRHDQLMREELEASPLVHALPPMPGERNTRNVPGVPASFRPSPHDPLPALKKRKTTPDESGAIGEGFAAGQVNTTNPTHNQFAARLGYYPNMLPPEVVRDNNSMSNEGAGYMHMLNPPPLQQGLASESLKRKADSAMDVLAQASLAQTHQAAPVHQSMQAPFANVQQAAQFYHAAPPQPLVFQSELHEDATSAAPRATIQSVAIGGAANQTPVSLPDSAPGATLTSETALTVITTTKSEPGDDAKPLVEIKRRRHSRSPKKVLVAKKEKELAHVLLQDKDDLLDCLDVEDCDFLAENFWIFTVQQLRAVIMPPSDLDDTKTADQAKEVHKLLLDKLEHEGVFAPEETKGMYGSGTAFVEHSRLSAEARISGWVKRLESYTRYKEGGKVKKTTEGRFPLSGPISFLFPKSTLNFLASIQVETLWNFLCMKKTETGAITDMMRIWRNESDLQPLNALALAKHLLGIAARIEAALTTIPCVDSRMKAWMSDPIIVLTGAARDFLLDDQNINNAKLFIDTRTKDLATALVAWREKRGFPPLKGSGKVAMISGWKANAREAVEAERNPGKVLDIDLESMVDFAIFKEETDPAPKYLFERSASSTSQAAENKPVERQLKYALHTELFLQDVLGEEISALLFDAGVKTAVELFDARQGPNLVKRLMEANAATNTPECISLVEKWCSILNAELDQLRAKEPLSKPHETKKAKVSKSPLSASAEKLSSRTNSKTYTDPFECLSELTQTFLKEAGITTAEQFLSTRTTDIADAFVKYRDTRNMPVLKGQGAIASVSGWKAQCRRAAKEIGMDDLAVLEPKGREGFTKEVPLPRARQIVTKLHNAPGFMQAHPSNSVTIEGVLKDKSRHAFGVVCIGDVGKLNCLVCSVIDL